MGTSIGHGGCGVVVVPPNQTDVKTTSKFVSKFTENVECEIEGIVLALNEAVSFYHQSEIRNDNCYIFTDCESAIDVFVNQNDVVKWSDALLRAWKLKKDLDQLEVNVVLAWVPGHCGIDFNERADSAAKEGCSKAVCPTPTTNDELSYLTISKWIDDMCKSEWQEKWLRCESGQFTREIITKTPANIRIPNKRDTGISLIRCLLNNTSVANNMFRMKLTDDPDCDCGKGRQTVEHVILQCDIHKTERLHLKMKVSSIWESSRKSGNIDFDLNLLLNPYESKLNKKEAQLVAKEFEFFLSQINFSF